MSEQEAKLEAAYNRLSMLHTETMRELARVQKAQLCNSWWCRLKRLCTGGLRSAYYD